jgi:hypothetical protein
VCSGSGEINLFSFWVLFADTAFVQCPLTLDYETLKMFLNELKPDQIPELDTDLGAAIPTGLIAFDFTSQTDKVILLITDGEDNEKQGLAAARKALGKGEKIFIFGMGEPAGGPVPAGDGKGGFKKGQRREAYFFPNLTKAVLKKWRKPCQTISRRTVPGFCDFRSPGKNGMVSSRK